MCKNKRKEDLLLEIENSKDRFWLNNNCAKTVIDFNDPEVTNAFNARMAGFLKSELNAARDISDLYIVEDDIKKLKDPKITKHYYALKGDFE